jgi:hypothetical protein
MIDEFAASLPDRGVLLGKLRRTAGILVRYVIPVFQLNDRDKPNSEGSGVLARLGDRFYLVTAAHVLDACTTGVFIPQGRHGIIPLTGNSIVTGRKPGTTRLEDQVDIGFIRLSDEETSRFGSECFLDLEHVTAPPMPNKTTMFVVLGFPARDQEDDFQNSTITTPLTNFMTGHADERAYCLAGVDQRANILLKYVPKNIVTKRSIGSPPDFHGISGGGVWPVSIFDEPDIDSPPVFAGIVVERPEKYASALLVTRSTVIKYFVRQFDDT